MENGFGKSFPKILSEKTFREEFSRTVPVLPKMADIFVKGQTAFLEHDEFYCIKKYYEKYWEKTKNDFCEKPFFDKCVPNRDYEKVLLLKIIEYSFFFPGNRILD